MKQPNVECYSTRLDVYFWADRCFLGKCLGKRKLFHHPQQILVNLELLDHCYTMAQNSRAIKKVKGTVMMSKWFYKYVSRYSKLRRHFFNTRNNYSDDQFRFDLLWSCIKNKYDAQLISFFSCTWWNYDIITSLSNYAFSLFKLSTKKKKLRFV